MFYSIWLIAAALAGWAAGKIAGQDGFGTGADILLGITGAFVVRWSVENIGISLQDVYLLLFSIWGAAALPALVRFGIRRHNRSKGRKVALTLISLAVSKTRSLFRVVTA